MKKLTASYLYADGHAVLVYEKHDKDAGEISFVEIHEKWTKAHCAFTGRLCFSRYHHGILNLCSKAQRIAASQANTDHGSENTKRMGIAVGGLTISFKNKCEDELHWTTMPDLISGPFTYQPKQSEAYNPNESHWGLHKIAKFHPVKTAKVEQFPQVAVT